MRVLLLIAIVASIAHASLTALESREKQQFCAKQCGGLVVHSKGGGGGGLHQSIKLAASERRKCRIECVKSKPHPVLRVIKKAPPPPPPKVQRRRFH